MGSVKFGTVVNIAEFEHRGISIMLRRIYCEGTFSKPGSFWLVAWKALYQGDEYGNTTEVWDPSTDEDIARSVELLAANARLTFNKILGG